MKQYLTILIFTAAVFFMRPLHCLYSAETSIDQATMDQWAEPYRHWNYYPEHVISANPNIPGYEIFKNADCPTVFQRPGDNKWYMTFIGFDGQGYQSFLAESKDLIQWNQKGLALGFGPENEFDHGGRVLGAYLYESYNINAPRMLKKLDGKYWSLYGAYPRQGGYELRPGYEGIASSANGLTWQRAQDKYTLSIYDADCASWEKDCIYQPWLVESDGQFYDFYNAASGSKEQSGVAFSTDLFTWKRYAENPVIRDATSGYNVQFSSDPKVYKDGDHWIMFFFGLNSSGAHIMAAFSRDLLHWTTHPVPLYKAGGHPKGLDKQYAHKTSIVYNPKNDTFYLYYCAVGNKGRGIGLLTSKPVTAGMDMPDR